MACAVLGERSRAEEAEEPSPPNIVVILADDLGYSDLGCYGGEIETPHLDRLAEGGLLFTQFYNTARCWPTRASLLTGYYAQQVRRDALPDVPSGGRGTRPDWALLLPERLAAVGYRSYHSGKWHVDGMPLETGFHHSYYLRDQGRFFNPRVHFLDDQRLDPVPPGTDYYATTAIADRAVEQLDRHQRDHEGKPFFLYLAFTAPHFPLHALPEDIRRYEDRYQVGWDEIRADRYRRQRSLGLVRSRLSPVEQQVGPPYDFPDALTTLGSGEVNRPIPWNELTDQQRIFQARKMAVNAAMIDRMDREIGRVLDQLRRMEVWEDTLVCFLSDNGASAEIMVRDDGHDPAAAPGSAETYLCLGPGWSTACNTPFRRHKTWVHEGGIATPFIVHWPAGVAARGEQRSTPAHVIDLVPTFLALTGCLITTETPQAPPWPGKNLLPVFERPTSIEREELWWSHEGNRAIRQGPWKLVAEAGGPWELYDLASDRTETTNLAAEQPERVEAMARSWMRTQDTFVDVATRDLEPSR